MRDVKTVKAVLQWGHGGEAVESLLAPEGATVRHEASMGPRR